MTQELLTLCDASFGYGERIVVRIDSLAFRPGTCIGIFGPNGSGKSTLVRGVLGLLAPISGTVKTTSGVRFGYLPQQRSMELHWPMSALDAAAMVASSRRWLGWLGQQSARVCDSMASLGVAELARRPFAQLSGGQRQRVLLAGALADHPDLLVLDEPTDGLDVASQSALFDALSRAAQAGLCVVIVSHDVEDIAAICSRTIWLHPSVDASAPSVAETLPVPDFMQRLAHVGPRA